MTGIQNLHEQEMTRLKQSFNDVEVKHVRFLRPSRSLTSQSDRWMASQMKVDMSFLQMKEKITMCSSESASAVQVSQSDLVLPSTEHIQCSRYRAFTGNPKGNDKRSGKWFCILWLFNDLKSWKQAWTYVKWNLQEFNRDQDFRTVQYSRDISKSFLYDW